jgi:hypothetical protein
MKVELTRLRIKKGKSPRVDEWLKMINQRIDEAVATLDREQMKLEVIFREVIGEDDFLCWFTVQDEIGEPIETSPFDLDREHRQFGEECIDHDYGGHEAQPQVILVPAFVARAMNWTNPHTSRVEFERREIVRRRLSDSQPGTGVETAGS